MDLQNKTKMFRDILQHVPVQTPRLHSVSELVSKQQEQKTGSNMTSADFGLVSSVSLRIWKRQSPNLQHMTPTVALVGASFGVQQHKF